MSAVFKPKNFSEAENFFLDIQRRIALNQGEITIRSIIADRIRTWKEIMGIQGEFLNHGTAINPQVS